MPDYSLRYAETEWRLRALLRAMEPWLASDELAEVSEYLAAREYGLALETLASILWAGRYLPVPWAAIEEVDSLADAMHLYKRQWMERVPAHAD
jgi:hypothetical protein